MGKGHQNQKKTAQPKSETNALAIRKINTVNRKQTSRIQNSTEIYMDLWNSAMGDSLQALSIQDSLLHSERTLVNKQPQDSCRSTNEHRRSAKYFSRAI
jgi:hypothetical protein